MSDAKNPRPSRPHRVAVLALDHVLPLEVSMPFLVFGDSRLGYEVLLCGRRAGRIATDHGWPIVADHGLTEVEHADTVVVPAAREFLGEIPADVLEALRSAHRNGARIASICTGAFVLAAAGLLDGRRATTHWYYADELSRRHPAVEVAADVLYVDEDRIVTSAGVVSGIDLCLHLVRTDHGAAVANEIARNIVAAPNREGGQAQFIRHTASTPASPGLGEAREWALEHLREPLTVVDIAAHAHMSRRTFERRFAAETGLTPGRWLIAARVDLARELLETTDETVGYISDFCGLGTVTNLRHHFRRATGTTPQSYRRAFSRQ